jgi:hypothetical protein
MKYFTKLIRILVKFKLQNKASFIAYINQAKCLLIYLFLSSAHISSKINMSLIQATCASPGGPAASPGDAPPNLGTSA